MQSSKFLYLLFSTTYIDRWNDQIRAVEFNELDKQAHKMVITYVLSKIEEKENKIKIDYKKLINYGICEFIYRAVLTDLKPQVFHHLKKHKKNELDEFVKNEIFEIIDDKLKTIFIEYLNSDENEIERRILSAASFLATKWEFDKIYNFSPNGFEKDEIKRKLEFEVEDFFDLVGVRRIEFGSKTKNFLEICATLRFQKRWSKTPRLPQTSVLGHMLMVGVFSYLFSLEYGSSDKKLVNNFWVGLFHDIPEALTRDIISPIKYGVKGLDKILSEYEKEIIEEKLLPFLPNYMRDEMRYFIVDEFANKINLDGKIKKIDDYNLMYSKFNKDKFNGIDGSLIKVGDNLGAFIEAVASIKNGVSPKELVEAKNNLLKKYKNFEMYGIDFDKIFKNLEKD